MLCTLNLFVFFMIFKIVYGKEHLLLKKLAEKNIITRDNARISWKECNLSYDERLNCGFSGVSEEQCYSRECCWGESTTEGVPWCYHSKTTSKRHCSASPDEKIECGYYGVRKEQCLALDCCWQPSSLPEAPWCFHSIRVPVYEGECGVPVIPPNVLSRVVGGDEAKPHSWPWIASFQRRGEHNCGGSLINNQWVVTAAHCQIPIEGASIVLGLHSHSEHDEQQQSFGIVEMIPHPVFGTKGYGGLSSDIMLIKLDRPVEFKDHISPVCLIEPGNDLENGRHSYLSGWGNLRIGGDAPDKLQQAMVPIVSTYLCNASESYAGKIDETMLCAGYAEGGKGSCHMDSGGPLVVYDDDHWTLVGVVSWGGVYESDKCVGSSYPGVYCRVSEFIIWIERTIGEHSN